MYTTLNLPLLPISQTKERTLEQIIHRDGVVIKYYHMVLQREGELNTSGINRLTLTTKKRKRVRYDVKKQFRGYTREFQELRDNAVELFRATGVEPMKMRKKTTRRMNVQRPKGNGYTTGTCRIIHDLSLSLTSYWLRLYNPFDKGDLLLPLKIGQGALEYLESRDIDIRHCRTVHISRAQKGWVAHLTFSDESVRSINPDRTHPVPAPPKVGSLAVLALDPGVRTPYTGVWLTPHFELKQQ